MKLEPIIQSEVSQKDKDQYSILTHIYGILKDGNNNTICKTEKETQMYRTDFWTLWEKVRVGCSERIALKQVYYKGETDHQPRLDETSAQGWCTGKTQRDGMVREVGRGIGVGNTCKSMAESCQSKKKKHYNL